MATNSIKFSRKFNDEWEMQDPFYDSEYYRKDGGDGTGHWVYDKVYFWMPNSRVEINYILRSFFG